MLKKTIHLLILIFIFSCNKEISTQKFEEPIIWKNDLIYFKNDDTTNNIDSIISSKVTEKVPKITKKIKTKNKIKKASFNLLSLTKKSKPHFSIDEFINPDKWYKPILIILIYLAILILAYLGYWGILGGFRNLKFLRFFEYTILILLLLLLIYYNESIIEWFKETIDWFKNGCKIDWGKHSFFSLPENFPFP